MNSNDEFNCDPLEVGLCFRNLDSANAIEDVIHSLGYLDKLVDTVFANVSDD
jgi:hypothetical protein